MEKGNWNKINITIPCNLGNMTEKRINNIVEGLKTEGIQVNATIAPGPLATVFVVNEGKGNIVIEANALSLVSVVTDEFFMDSIKENFSKILNVLLIDDANRFVFNLEGTVDTDDSHAESLDNFNKKYQKMLVAPVYGVGYRFLLEDETVTGEFKIEPLIADRTKYYLQMILNSKAELTICDAFKVVSSKICPEFVNQYESILKG